MPERGARYETIRKLAAVEGGMADVAAGDEVDYVLGDVGGVVADAFEVLRDEDQFEGRENHRGIFHHVGEQFAEKLIAEAVHLIVALKDALREILIAAHERVQAVANHSFGQLAHARKIHIGLYLRVAKDAHGGLRDIDGLIADAFEIAIDARNGQQKPKVGGHGGLQGQQALDALINFDLHLVDGVFFVEHGFGEVLIGVQHGVDGLMDGALGEAAHPEQALLQFFEIMLPNGVPCILSSFRPEYIQLLSCATPRKHGPVSSEPAGDVSLRAVIGGRGEELRSLVVLDQFSIEHECREVAGARGLLHVVRDDRHRAAVFQLEHELFDFRGGDGIERGAGLIEKQHFRIDRQRASDAEPLLLAAGERERGLVQVILHFLPKSGAAQAVLDEIGEAAFVTIDAKAVSDIVKDGFRETDSGAERPCRRGAAS